MPHKSGALSAAAPMLEPRSALFAQAAVSPSPLNLASATSAIRQLVALATESGGHDLHLLRMTIECVGDREHARGVMKRLHLYLAPSLTRYVRTSRTCLCAMQLYGRRESHRHHPRLYERPGHAVSSCGSHASAVPLAAHVLAHTLIHPLFLPPARRMICRALSFAASVLGAPALAAPLPAILLSAEELRRASAAASSSGAAGSSSSSSNGHGCGGDSSSSALSNGSSNGGGDSGVSAAARPIDTAAAATPRVAVLPIAILLWAAAAERTPLAAAARSAANASFPGSPALLQNPNGVSASAQLQLAAATALLSSSSGGGGSSSPRGGGGGGSSSPRLQQQLSAALPSSSLLSSGAGGGSASSSPRSPHVGSHLASNGMSMGGGGVSASAGGSGNSSGGVGGGGGIGGGGRAALALARRSLDGGDQAHHIMRNIGALLWAVLPPLPPQQLKSTAGGAGLGGKATGTIGAGPTSDASNAGGSGGTTLAISGSPPSIPTRGLSLSDVESLCRMLFADRGAEAAASSALLAHAAAVFPLGSGLLGASLTSTDAAAAAGGVPTAVNGDAAHATTATTTSSDVARVGENSLFLHALSAPALPAAFAAAVTAASGALDTAPLTSASFSSPGGSPGGGIDTCMSVTAFIDTAVESVVVSSLWSDPAQFSSGAATPHSTPALTGSNTALALATTHGPGVFDGDDVSTPTPTSIIGLGSCALGNTLSSSLSSSSSSGAPLPGSVFLSPLRVRITGLRRGTFTDAGPAHHAAALAVTSAMPGALGVGTGAGITAVAGAVHPVGGEGGSGGKGRGGHVSLLASSLGVSSSSVVEYIANPLPLSSSSSSPNGEAHIGVGGVLHQLHTTLGQFDAQCSLLAPPWTVYGPVPSLTTGIGASPSSSTGGGRGGKQVASFSSKSSAAASASQLSGSGKHPATTTHPPPPQQQLLLTPLLPTLLIADCVDSTIILSAAFRDGVIVGCTRSTIILGPGAGHLLLDGCEGCTVIAAPAAGVTLHNCGEVELLSCSHLPPLLSGDTRQTRLGPYAAAYAGVREQAAVVGLLPLPVPTPAPTSSSVAVGSSVGNGGGGSVGRPGSSTGSWSDAVAASSAASSAAAHASAAAGAAAAGASSAAAVALARASFSALCGSQWGRPVDGAYSSSTSSSSSSSLGGLVGLADGSLLSSLGGRGGRTSSIGSNNSSKTSLSSPRGHDASPRGGSSSSSSSSSTAGSASDGVAAATEAGIAAGGGSGTHTSNIATTASAPASVNVSWSIVTPHDFMVRGGVTPLDDPRRLGTAATAAHVGAGVGGEPSAATSTALVPTAAATAAASDTTAFVSHALVTGPVPVATALARVASNPALSTNSGNSTPSSSPPSLPATTLTARNNSSVGGAGCGGASELTASPAGIRVSFAGGCALPLPPAYVEELAGRAKADAELKGRMEALTAAAGLPPAGE